jgi:hypothetical protein
MGMRERDDLVWKPKGKRQFRELDVQTYLFTYLLTYSMEGNIKIYPKE